MGATGRAYAQPVSARRRLRLTGVVGRLASVNTFVALLGLLTGPLQARALGADGRGLLAAILVPLGLAPVVASLGLTTFAIREAARGRSASLLLGSLFPVTLVVGLASVIAAPFIAGALAEGRSTVRLFITIGFVLLPIGMVSDLLASITVGRERWNVYILVRLIPPVFVTVGITVLFALGHLTVASAAALSLGASVLSIAPVLPVLWSEGRPRLHRSLTRSGLRFGLKAWIGGLGSVTNARLDQLLMIVLVPPRQLGLYVVAVTASGFLVTPVVGALSAGSLPRFVSADGRFVGDVLRACVLGALVVGAALALPLLWLLPLVFGADFAGSVPMAWILLAANVPLAATSVLGSALTGSGHPGYTAVSEIVTLAVTIPALLLLLPPLGGVGAALVSLLAYTLGVVVLLVGASRHFEISIITLVVPRWRDVTGLLQRLRRGRGR